MKPNPPSHILCLGDSLTAGFGVASTQSYPALLQKRLLEHGYQCRVINAGLSGDTTEGTLWRMDGHLTQTPDLAIVTIGLNDGFMGIPAEEISKNLETIIKKLQQHNARVVLGGLRLPSDFPDTTRQEFASIYPALATKHTLPLIPFFLEGIFEVSRYNQWDNIHPNAAGYRMILENVWKVISLLLFSAETATW